MPPDTALPAPVSLLPMCPMGPMKHARGPAWAAKGRGGQALVEFALTLPILLIMLVGTLEVARALYIQSKLALAAERAARQGALTNDDAQIYDAVSATLSDIPLEQLRITICPGGAGARAAGGYVAVQVAYDMQLAIPFLDARLTLKSDAARVIEGTAGGGRAYPACGQ